MQRNALALSHKSILGAWALLATGLAIYGIASNDSPEWAGVVATIAGLFLGVSFVILLVVWLVMRFAVRGDRARVVVAALGPPIAVGLLALTTWLF